MPNLLHELENNEALLMMYLAGELPSEDRAEVEHMLSSDGGLRMELQEIRSMYAEAFEGLATLDRLEPISASAETIALRGTSRMIKQWKVDRLRAQPAVPARTGLRYPMWVYPTSAVASILVGVLVWWGISGPTPESGLTVASNSNGGDSGSLVAPTLADNGDEKATLLESSFSSEPAGLADAEAQANVLVSRSDDPAASVFQNDLSQ